MSIKKIATNKKALFDYEILEKLEAGVVLVGTEVKSIREGKVNLKDSFVKFFGKELWALNIHISPYSFGNRNNHEPSRTRKLLLNKREILKLEKKIKERGFTIIPIKLYIKGQRVKLEIALCKGKQLYDKRQSIKKREQDREMARLRKNY